MVTIFWQLNWKSQVFKKGCLYWISIIKNWQNTLKEMYNSSVKPDLLFPEHFSILTAKQVLIYSSFLKNTLGEGREHLK